MVLLFGYVLFDLADTRTQILWQIIIRECHWRFRIFKLYVRRYSIEKKKKKASVYLTIRHSTYPNFIARIFWRAIRIAIYQANIRNRDRSYPMDESNWSYQGMNQIDRIVSETNQNYFYEYLFCCPFSRYVSIQTD